MADMSTKGVKPPPMTPHSDTSLEATRKMGAHNKTSASQLSHDSELPHESDIEFVNDTIHLKQNGKKVVLTSSEIDEVLNGHAAEELQKRNKKVPSPTQTGEKEAKSTYWATHIGQHGMKSAHDVIVFLKSPDGKATKKQIHDQLAQRVAIQDDHRQHHLDKIRKHRLIAFLLLTAFYKKKAHAKALNEFIQKQIDKTLAQHKAILDQRTAAGAIASAPAQLYSASLTRQMIKSLIQAKLLESQALVDEIAAIEKQREAITKRYNAFNAAMNTLDTFYDSLEADAGLTTAEQIALIEKRSALNNQEIEALRAKIDFLVAHDRDEQAFELLHELQGLNSQEGGMQDMLSVLKGEKSFYNADGVKVPSYKDAEFILSNKHDNKQKIIKENGQYYLLLDSEDLTDANRVQAQRSYESARPNISNLKKLIQHNQGLEFTLNDQKMESTFKRSEVMQKELALLINQSGQIKSAEASVAALIQKPNIGPGDVAKMPTPKPTMTQTKSPQKTTTQSYRQILQLMQSHPIPETIALIQGWAKSDGQPEMKKAADTLRPGMPIPQITMGVFLANLPRLGVSAYKPNVTAIQSPSPLAKTHQETTDPKPHSPFSMKPPGH